MTSWLDTIVAGEPEACRRAAAELHHLADALTKAADLATHHAALPVTALDGLAGRAFRDRAVRLGDRCRSARHHAELLGAGLEDLADELDGCGFAMEAARDGARARLLVTDSTIQAPVLGPVDPAQDAWQAAVAAVGVVRHREAAAQAVWRGILAGLTQDSPSDAHDAPIPPPVRWSEPHAAAGGPGAGAGSVGGHLASHPEPRHGPRNGPHQPAQQGLVVEPVPAGLHTAVVTESIAEPWPHAPEWIDV